MKLESNGGGGFFSNYTRDANRKKRKLLKLKENEDNRIL